MGGEGKKIYCGFEMKAPTAHSLFAFLRKEHTAKLMKKPLKESTTSSMKINEFDTIRLNKEVLK